MSNEEKKENDCEHDDPFSDYTKTESFQHDFVVGNGYEIEDIQNWLLEQIDPCFNGDIKINITVKNGLISRVEKSIITEVIDEKA